MSVESAVASATSPASIGWLLSAVVLGVLIGWAFGYWTGRKVQSTELSAYKSELRRTQVRLRTFDKIASTLDRPAYGRKARKQYGEAASATPGN